MVQCLFLVRVSPFILFGLPCDQSQLVLVRIALDCRGMETGLNKGVVVWQCACPWWGDEIGVSEQTGSASHCKTIRLPTHVLQLSASVFHHHTQHSFDYH
jgi:hypothetical protein